MAENPSPSPKDEEKKPGAPDAPAVDSAPKSAEGSGLTADALSDGTVPTVLTTGDGLGATIKPLVDPSKRRVTSIYRRADITTSLITMVATLAIFGIIFGGYLYLNKSKVVPPPKLTTLSDSEISKLGGFLGNNLGSGGAQILTVSSSSLFKGRLAVENDLKVIGNVDVTGAVNTGDLTVTKTTNIANTNIKGALTVSGPTTLQGPAILAGGATIGSNLAVAGNGTFGGAISAGSFNTKNLNVTGDLNLSGHLVITGAQPKVTSEIGAGPSGKATVDGTDSGGTISITTGAVPVATTGQTVLVTLKFNTPYSKTPKVLLTAVGLESGQTNYYVLQTPTGFTIALTSPAKSGTGYAYNYWVIQ